MGLGSNKTLKSYEDPSETRATTSAAVTKGWWEELPYDPVTKAYHDVLGRNPETEGLDYWRGKLGDFKSAEDFNAAFGEAAWNELNPVKKEEVKKTPIELLQESGLTTTLPTAQENKEREALEVASGMAGYKAEMEPAKETSQMNAVSDWISKGRIKSQGDAFLEAKTFVSREYDRLEKMEKSRLEGVARGTTAENTNRIYNTVLQAVGWQVEDTAALRQLNATLSEADKERQVRLIIGDLEYDKALATAKIENPEMSDAEFAIGAFNNFLTAVGSIISG